MSYRDFKDLARRTASCKVLIDKAFNIAKNLKCNQYQRGLASMVYKFFDKKSASGGDVTRLKNQITQNQQLAEELHKPIIRKYKKRRVYSSLKDSIWGADLADMQLISKFNKRIRFLLRVIDLYSKYVRVVPLKDKNGVTIVNEFQKILDDSERKPNEIWVDQGSEFYNNSFKK